MLEAERAVLSAALVSPEKSLETGLAAGDFSDNVGQTIWKAITGRASEGKSVDVITLLSELGEQYRRAVGDCMAETSAPANIKAYAAAVKRERKRRDLEALLKDTDTNKPDEAIGRLMTGLISLNRSEKIQSYTMKELMTRMVEEIDNAAQRAKSGESIGVPSGFIGVDRVMGGFHKSDLVTVAARPAMGKTAWMLSTSINAARRGCRVGIVSAEMAALQLGSRALSGAANVSGHKIRNGQLRDEEMTRLTHAMQQLAGLPVSIMDPDRCRPSDVLMQAHVWAAQGLDLLAVDYLQRLQPDARDQNRSREVGEMACQLKTIAKSLNIPVIAIAQLSRRCEERADKRPLMSDLRDSGEIEQESDEVLFLYRDCVYNPQADPQGAEIIIGKNRHGPIGHIDMAYIPERLVWCDPDLRNVA